jgi:hypothetical protein
MDTITTRTEVAVLFAERDAPPMNLLGPALVRGVVSLIRARQRRQLREPPHLQECGSLISHVNLTRVPEYRAEASTVTGEPSTGEMA